MSDRLLDELATMIEEAADEAQQWAQTNQGYQAQEIFVAQVATSGTLKLLASKLRAAALRARETDGDGR